MSAVVRYVGTPTHPGLLFPTGFHVVAVAHCDFRREDVKWWRVCGVYDSDAPNVALPLARRSTRAFWRGLPTGIGWSDHQWRFLPRARLVREFGGNEEEFDVGFDRGPKKFAREGGPELQAAVAREWVRRPRVDRREHLTHAFLVHVDGNTASWGLSHKLVSGGVVLWIESDHGYREHFYALLKPWVHYVPVAVDMSDLVAALRWLAARPDQTAALSRRAAHLARGRLRAQDVWCYVVRLLLSVSRAQTRGPRATEDALRRFLDPAVNPALSKSRGGSDPKHFLPTWEGWREVA